MTEDNFYMLGPAGQIRIPNWPMPPLMYEPRQLHRQHGQCLPLDGQQAEGLGVEIFPGMSCSELV